MAVNRRHISMREGAVYVDGVKILDQVSCSFTFTPDVSEKRRVGDRTPNTRYLGYKITGKISEYRSTKWLADVAKKYIETGETPEMTIQGVMNDENSDYADDYGIQSVTANGCVITSGTELIQLQSDGDVVQDSFDINAKSIVM